MTTNPTPTPELGADIPAEAVADDPWIFMHRSDIVKRDGRIKELEAKQTLTEEQVDALVLACGALDAEGYGEADLVRAAFPEVFTPRFEWADDEAVMVQYSGYSGEDFWTIANRADGGKWITPLDANPIQEDALAERYEVRRLSSAAHAELLTIMRGEQA